MADRRQRSKRHSNSKQKLLKGFTLYLCHNIDCDDIVDTLRRNGIRVKRHREFFSGSTPDTELLKKVGKLRWILITADQKQRTRNIEKEMIKRYKVRQFVLTSAEIGNIGQLIVDARKPMRNLCSKNAGPFVASISAGGTVALRSLI